MLRPLFLALLVVLPGAGSAAWSSHGQREPDTLQDARDGWMWAEADAEPGTAGRIYFQAYPTLGETPMNPNVGSLGSRLRVVPVLHWEAMLGIWKDCNRDGYVGLGEGAAGAYRSELLLERDVCPVQVGAGEAVHHDGIWVREVIAIGRADACRDEADRGACGGLEATAPRPGVRDDDEAIVWGDIGAPGAAGFEACKLWPLPRGATSGTGGILRYADCASEHRLIGAVNTVDNDGALGLAIDDPHHPEESGSLLVHELPASAYDNPRTGRTGLAQPGAERGTFRAWDCSEAIAEVPDPTRPGHALARVPAAEPTLAPEPLDASLVAALERASDGAAGDCDDRTSTPYASAWPSLESPGAASSHTGRAQNDVVFRFYEGAGRAPLPTLALEPWSAAVPAARVAAGLGAAGALDGGLPVWKAMASFVATPQLIERSRLSPVPAGHWTFYAHLGDASRTGFALPSASAGIYGAEACQGLWAGVRGGWVCDPDAWWTDEGGDAMPRDAQGAPLAARPQQAYHLRDVDCEDGALARGTPAYASLALLSEDGPCQEVPEKRAYSSFSGTRSPRRLASSIAAATAWSCGMPS